MNRFVGPLPVSFNPEMAAGFFKCDFDLPSFDKPFDDPARRRFPIRAQQSLCFKLLIRVSDNYPPDRHCFFSDVIPDTFAARDFDFPIFFPIPMLDFKPFSFCFRIIYDRLQRRQPHTFFARSSHLTGLFRCRLFIKRRIESDSRHYRNFVFDRS